MKHLLIALLLTAAPAFAQGETEAANDLAQARTVLAREVLIRRKTEARLTELERKVAGMQKQITILHAKKADKQ